MFLNLLAEMTKRGISKANMAKKLNMSICTFNRKLKNKTSFTLNEIFEIQNILNDENCTFDYLFKKSSPNGLL